MRKDRCESKKQTLSESTQVHNPWSGWGANFEKPGGHRFTAKPDYWEKNKYSNDSKIIKLISTSVRGETQDLEGNDMSLCENFPVFSSLSPSTLLIGPGPTRVPPAPASLGAPPKQAQMCSVHFSLVKLCSLARDPMVGWPAPELIT